MILMILRARNFLACLCMPARKLACLDSFVLRCPWTEHMILILAANWRPQTQPKRTKRGMLRSSWNWLELLYIWFSHGIYGFWNLLKQCQCINQSRVKEKKQVCFTFTGFSGVFGFILWHNSPSFTYDMLVFCAVCTLFLGLIIYCAYFSTAISWFVFQPSVI